MKFYWILLIAVFSSCSPQKEEQKTESKEKTDSLATEEPVAEEPIEEEPEIMSFSEIREAINKNFNNLAAKIMKNEFGDGDCSEYYKSDKTKINGNIAIENHIDCGEYGFTNCRLINTKDDAPLYLQKIRKSIQMDDPVPYLMQEWLVDFNDTNIVYFRKYKTDNYDLSDIPESVQFQIEKDKTLVIRNTLSDIEESKSADN